MDLPFRLVSEILNLFLAEKLSFVCFFLFCFFFVLFVLFVAILCPILAYFFFKLKQSSEGPFKTHLKKKRSSKSAL